MKARRTCDRCYKIKAACAYVEASEACARCTRLGHKCETVRAILQSGRPRTLSKVKRQSQSISTPESISEVSDVTASPRSSVSVQLSPILTRFREHEVVLIEFLLHPAQVSDLLYGQTFQRSLQESLASQLFSPKDDGRDCVLAMAQALSTIKNISFIDPHHMSDTQRGSMALTMYRKSRASTLENAQNLLGHALALVTFNDMSMGSTTLPITRAALLQVKPWQTILTSQPNPWMVCLLFVEMSECLLSGQVPVFRYEVPPAGTIVDRYYGISHELLPWFYDICVLYRSIHLRQASSHDLLGSIEQIAHSVDQWTPNEVINLTHHISLDEAERQHFLIQARAFKSTAQLLLLQALRSPTSDMLAYAKAVEVEIEITCAMEHGKGRPKYLLFPYFVACVELQSSIEEKRNEIAQMMNEISNNMAPRACQTMLSCLEDIWQNKQKTPSLPWFQCISEGQPITMGP